jgi:hypothetical protein
MKKLLMITGCLLIAGLYSCDDDKAEKKDADTGVIATERTDSASVAPISSAEAREMIRYFKSDTMNANRAKLFRGGIDVSKLTSILKNATRFYIFAAAYPGNFADSVKRNMPTFVVQVFRSSTSAESEILYYAVERETFCPPPPICYSQIESAVD